MGKSSHSTASGTRVNHPADIDLLEQTVSLEGPLPAQRATHGLDPIPIPTAWLIEGNPHAREKTLGYSSDGAASAHMWDCTSGRFQWECRSEEFVHVLEGGAIVEIAGVRQRLRPGDTHVFPAGSRFRWTVPEYVRAVTFRLRSSAKEPLGQRLHTALTRPWRTRRTRS